MKRFNYNECMKNHGGYAVTRNGHKVRLLCKDYTDENYVVGIIEHANFEALSKFNSEGKTNMNLLPHDLFTPTVKIELELWINCYPNKYHSHETREKADTHASFGRIACVSVNISCEGGDGL